MTRLFFLLLLYSTAGGKPAVMARQQQEKLDSCRQAFEEKSWKVEGKTFVVDLSALSSLDVQTLLCPICKKDWYRGTNNLILTQRGKVIEEIKSVKLFPPWSIFQRYSLPSQRDYGRGYGPITPEHGKHRVCIYFDRFQIKEIICYDEVAELRARVDSLEAKLSRAHIVAVQDSEYVKFDRFITGAVTDTVRLVPLWEWVKRARYTISFEPEK